jgi:hypothetical protein
MAFRGYASERYRRMECGARQGGVGVGAGCNCDHRARSAYPPIILRKIRTVLLCSHSCRVNDQAIRRVLEVAGVEFFGANGGGPGVRLRSGQQQLGRAMREAYQCRTWSRQQEKG